MDIHVDRVDGEAEAVRIRTFNDEGEVLIELQVTPVLDGLRVVSNGTAYSDTDPRGFHRVEVFPR